MATVSLSGRVGGVKAAGLGQRRTNPPGKERQRTAYGRPIGGAFPNARHDTAGDVISCQGASPSFGPRGWGFETLRGHHRFFLVIAPKKDPLGSPFNPHADCVRWSATGREWGFFMHLDQAFERYLRHHRAEGSSPKTLEWHTYSCASSSPISRLDSMAGGHRHPGAGPSGKQATLHQAHDHERGCTATVVDSAVAGARADGALHRVEPLDPVAADRLGRARHRTAGGQCGSIRVRAIRRPLARSGGP